MERTGSSWEIGGGEKKMRREGKWQQLERRGFWVGKKKSGKENLEERKWASARGEEENRAANALERKTGKHMH